MPLCAEHCSLCITSNCTRSDDWCAVVDCPNLCGMCMHKCKVPEHTEYICAHAIVACPNKEIGCTVNIARRKVSVHLTDCPASVVSCFVPGNVPLRRSIPETAPPTFFRRAVLTNVMTPIPLSIDAPTSASLQSIPVPMDLQNGGMQTSHGQPNEPSNEFIEQPILPFFPSSAGEHSCQKIIPRSNFNDHWLFHSGLLRQLDGFIELRCPLHWLGCQYVVVLLRPNSSNGRLLYNPEKGLFAVQFGSTTGSIPHPGCRSGDALINHSSLRLEDLPEDILIRLTQTLDNSTLLHLTEAASPNSRLRVLTENAIRERLVVFPNWVRVVYPPGSGNSGWKMTEFVYCLPEQTLTVNKWVLTLGRSELTKHLQICPFNERRINDKPFALVHSVRAEDMIPLHRI